MSENNKKKKPLLNNMKENNIRQKTEIAQKIAQQSHKAAGAAQQVEDGIFRVIRLFSTILDKVLFDSKHNKLVALILAIMMYVVVNYNSLSSVYTTSLKYNRSINGVKVTAKYNKDTFELTGLPSTANVLISGDATSVTNAVGSLEGTVIADLEGMSEGEHVIKLTVDGYGNNVQTIVDPTTVVVKLKKKTTEQFDISYDFINMNRMENTFSVGTPEFEYKKVNVRASKETLDSIAFVKALIDVSGQTGEFEQDAILVAYDTKGNPVSADIVPETVHVKVPVTSPSKNVPIKVQVNGTVPDGNAIKAITLDQQSVTVYASETVLAEISNVTVNLDATSLTKDSTITRPIVLPSGVGASSVARVTITVELGEATTRIVDGVPISYINNINNYKASQPDNKTTTSIEVTGTKENIDNVKAEDIYVFFDMNGVKPGNDQVFELQVTQPDTGLVRYALTEATYKMNVLGETVDVEAENGINNE